METIQLYNTRTGWMAAMMKDGKPNQYVISLFGTHHVPTAFTATASYETVKKDLLRLIPRAVITLS
jgi:hypothetical protein